MAGPTRVLLVDDDPSLADLMANQLGDLREEFSIRIETDPKDALEAVETGEIDCVVSDYHMPQMTGLELLRYVREIDADLPFILFTARGSEEIASDAVSAGVTDYFRKRRGADQWQVLANRIENVSARYRAEEAVQRRESALRQLARTVIDSSSTPVEELLTLGCETLGVEYSALVCRSEDGVEILVETADRSFSFGPTEGVPLADEIGDLTVDSGGIVAVAAGAEADDEDGFSSYIGTPVYVGERRYGTLCFCDRGDRTEFTAWERAFVELLGDWLGHELTSEWARNQNEAVSAARNRAIRARKALSEGDEETLRTELEAIERLLEKERPSRTPVSIELS